MASTTKSAKPKKGARTNNSGAAAEPEPDPAPPRQPSSSTSSFAADAAAATLGYDPTEYQAPHPDDVAGSTIKSKSKTKAKIKSDPSAAKDTKGKSTKDGSHCCFDPACQAPGARAECSQCHRAWYCGRACQRNDWKRHKRACRAAVAAAARAATRAREATAARRRAKEKEGKRGGGRGRGEDEVCVICYGPPVDPVDVCDIL